MHVARAKASPHEVESFIANTASQDGRNIRIVLQQEPGSGSALWIDSMHRGVLRGYPVYPDQVKGSKFERSQPFRSAAEAGTSSSCEALGTTISSMSVSSSALTNENMLMTIRSTQLAVRSTFSKRLNPSSTSGSRAVPWRTWRPWTTMATIQAHPTSAPIAKVSGSGNEPSPPRSLYSRAIDK